jgi:hypothetical protein
MIPNIDTTVSILISLLSFFVSCLFMIVLNFSFNCVYFNLVSSMDFVSIFDFVSSFCFSSALCISSGPNIGLSIIRCCESFSEFHCIANTVSSARTKKSAKRCFKILCCIMLLFIFSYYCLLIFDYATKILLKGRVKKSILLINLTAKEVCKWFIIVKNLENM